MEPLGINTYPNLTNLFNEEFIDGIKQGAKKRPPEESAAVIGIMKKMANYYTWNKNISVFERSSQNCSDMLIHVGKEPKLLKEKQKPNLFMFSKYFH